MNIISKLTHMTDRQQGIFLVIIGSFFLGAIGVFIRFASESIEPMTQSFGRLLFAFLLISLLNLVRGKLQTETFKIDREDWWLFAINGLAGFSLLSAMFTLSVIYTSISNTYFLLYTAPVWVVILGYIFLKEKITKQIIISILLAFLGLFFLFNPGNFQGNLLGNFYGLMTGICFGTYFLITGYLGEKYSSSTITFWAQFIGAIGVFPLIFIFDSEVVFLHSLTELLPVFGAGLMVFIGYVLLNAGLQLIKPNLGSILTLFEPLSALLYGWILFSEVPTISTVIGAILIISSIVYLTFR